jgi:hypothetical protein
VRWNPSGGLPGHCAHGSALNVDPDPHLKSTGAGCIGASWPAFRLRSQTRKNEAGEGRFDACGWQCDVTLRGRTVAPFHANPVARIALSDSPELKMANCRWGMCLFSPFVAPPERLVSILSKSFQRSVLCSIVVFHQHAQTTPLPGSLPKTTRQDANFRPKVHVSHPARLRGRC